MSAVSDSSSRICKDELCELEGVHLVHSITPFHVTCEVCTAPAGELCNADYRTDTGVKPRMCGPFHQARSLAIHGGDSAKPVKCFRDPWLQPSAEALDESILRATSDHKPHLLAQIAPIVENDYGKIAENEASVFRQLQRRIKRLCDAGVLLRVDLGKRLYAYISPNSRMLSDVDAIREQVMESFDREIERHSWRHCSALT